MEKRSIYNKYDAGTGFFGAILMPQIIALVFVMILMFVGSLSGISYQAMIENNYVMMISLLISPIAFFCVFALTNKIHRVNWKKACNLNFKVNIVNVLVSICISACCVFGVMQFVNLFDAIVELTGFKGSYSLPIPLSNAGWLIANLIFLAVLPSIFEELVFRGIIFNGLKQYGKNIAIFGSALLFALMHGGIEQTVYPIIVGIVLGLVMSKTNNIIYPMIIHFCNNAIVVVINYIYTVSNVQSQTQFTFSVYSVLFAIMLAILAVLVIWLLIKLLMKKENRISIEQIEVSDVNKSNYNFNKSNILLWYGIAIGILFWIVDLISGFVA